MFLANLQVSDFRNIADIHIELGPGINLFVGDNGAGKTALLEAIYLLGRGRSFRTPQSKLLIRKNESQLLVRADAIGDMSTHSLARSKGVGGENQTKIDGEHVNKQSRYAELLPLQTLLPGIADLVLDGPGIRREFVDWGLFHVEHSYLESARRYRKALVQRAAWLKSAITEDIRTDPWATGLVANGVSINDWRLQFTTGLNSDVQQTLKSLGADFGCELKYQDAGFGSAISAWEHLQASFDRDKRYATTHHGPHRADIEIQMDGVAAKTVASRGQAKVLASALMLGYAKQLRQRRGIQPILLMDDFGAELDSAHRERFFLELRALGCQVIATSTDTAEQLLGTTVVGDAHVFHVEQGKVERYS